MALINEQVQVTLSMKLNEAIADIAKAQTAVNDLTEKMKTMKQAGRENTDEFKAMQSELGAAQAKYDQVLANSNFKQLAQEQINQLKGIATAADQTGLSLKELDNIARQQRAIVRGSKAGSEEYKSAIAELAIIEAKQQAIRDEIAETSKAMKLQSSIFTTAAQVEEASMRDLNRWATGLREQIDRLKPGTEEWIKSNQNLKLVENQVAKIRTEFQKLDEPVKGSLQAIRTEVQKLQNELEQLPADTEEFKAKLKSLSAAKGELNKIELAINDIGRAAKKAGIDINDIKTAFSAAVGLTVADMVQQAIQGIKKIIDLNAEISDSVADVQKATGLSKIEVEGLVDAFKKIDTRTSLNELLKIATIGGQLGIEGKENVEKFTGAVDKLNVALGDEFTGGAEEITNVVGRLSTVLSDVKTGDTATDLLNLGNALNVLAAEGSATAPIVSDFANRIGGIAIPLGMTSGEVLGLSATMQELNITAERGGTAVTGVLAGMVSATDNYTQVLGINQKYLEANGIKQKSFADLVKTDVSAAFQLVLKRTNEMSTSNVDLIKVLNDLEIKENGARESFLKLSENQDLLRSKTNLATNALTQQNSILAEFDVKNNTLAGSIDRLQNKIANAFTDSTIATSLKLIVDGIIDLGDAFGSVGGEVTELMEKAFKPLYDIFSDVLSQLGLSISAYDVFKGLLEAFVVPLKAQIYFMGLVFEKLANVYFISKNLINSLGDLIDQSPALTAFFTTAYNAVSTFLMPLTASVKAIGYLANYLGVTTKSVAVAMDNSSEACENNTKQTKANEEEQKKLLKALADIANQTNDTAAATEKAAAATEKKTKSHEKQKQAIELVAGSIAYLKEQISQLNKELENAPPEEQAAVAQRLQLATTKLAEAEERLNEAKAAAKRLADGPLATVDNLPSIGATTVKGNDTPQNDQEQISKFKAIVTEKGKIAEDAYNDNILKNKLAEEKKLADIKALLGAAVDAAKIAADAIFSIQNQRLEKRKQNELKQNELIYKDRIKRAEGNEKEISRLEKEREQNATQIERAAFERKKRLDIAAALTNGALAITSILAQYPKFDGGIAMGIALGLATATTIAQVAKIASTKYEKGGILRGASHARGGIAAIDTTTGHKVAEFEGNEPYMILSGDTYKNNKQVVDSLLHSSMYQNGKPIFELGGVFGVQRSDIFPPVIQGGNNADMLAMISELRALRNDINNREKSSIKAHVVYSDIEQAADELQRIRTRAK